MNKQDDPQDMAPNASEATAAKPGARSKNEKKSAPTVAPNVPGEQSTPGQSGGQGGSPRNLNKNAQGSHSKDGASNQPSGVPAQKHIDRPQNSSPQSNSAQHPSNGQKHNRNPSRTLHHPWRSKTSRRNKHLPQSAKTSIRSAPRLLWIKTLDRSHLMRPEEKPRARAGKRRPTRRKTRATTESPLRQAKFASQITK